MLLLMDFVSGVCVDSSEFFFFFCIFFSFLSVFGTLKARSVDGVGGRIDIFFFYFF